MNELGFSLHAATRAGAQDERGRDALICYVLRPPLATERLKPGPDGLVRIELKKAFRDGTYAIDLDPLSLLCRLAAAVPPPRLHTVRYSGVLGAASRWRSQIHPSRHRRCHRRPNRRPRARRQGSQTASLGIAATIARSSIFSPGRSRSMSRFAPRAVDACGSWLW